MALFCLFAPCARAGITITSYGTEAQTNAYTFTRTQDFLDDDETQQPTATAQVSSDWMGTNLGGSSNTWHFVSSASATTTVDFASESLSIIGQGMARRETTTTVDFIDPTSQATMYGPGTVSGIGCQFVLDTSATYSISGQFNGEVVTDLISPVLGMIQNYAQFGSRSKLYSVSGVIPAGQYQFGITTGSYGPNLSPGVDDDVHNGSYSNLVFSVQVPEPVATAMVSLFAVAGCRHRRKLHAGKINGGSGVW